MIRNIQEKKERSTASLKNANLFEKKLRQDMIQKVKGKTKNNKRYQIR